MYVSTCDTIQVISFSSYFGTVGLSQALDWNVSFQMSDQVQQRALFDVHVSEHGNHNCKFQLIY
jgi:hypothetical protein